MCFPYVYSAISIASRPQPIHSLAIHSREPPRGLAWVGLRKILEKLCSDPCRTYHEHLPFSETACVEGRGSKIGLPEFPVKSRKFPCSQEIFLARRMLRGSRASACSALFPPVLP